MPTVLVVDDEPLALELVRSILHRRGFRVLASSDPVEAIGMFDSEAGDIDLLISDVRMPGMDGPKLAGHLIARKPGLPVLFISGFATEEDIQGAGLPSRFAFLGKPFRPTSLVDVVHKMLQDEGEVA
jgi:DNA-binding NtrC family response regulator